MDESTLLAAEASAQSRVDVEVRRAIQKLPKQPLNFDGHCVDCDDMLAAHRLSFGATTCVPCQTLRERRASLFAR